jgi:hypothetical protein
MDGDGRAQGINQEMAFAPFDLFAPVIAADAGRLLNGLHTLGIHDGRARVRDPAHPLALGSMEGTVQAAPEPLETKAPKMVEDRLPWWEIARQIAPATASAHDIEDGVEDAAQQVCVRSAPRRQVREIALDIRPLVVREVARIRCAHAGERRALRHVAPLPNMPSCSVPQRQ